MKPEKPKKMKTDIYFNGKYTGNTMDPYKFVDDIRKKRRLNIIPNQVNVAFYPQFEEVRISTEKGRVRRPLIIVENGKSKLTESILKKIETGKTDWSYLINHGIVEYLDAKEEENTIIALRPKNITKDTTHLELSPVAMMGLSAGLIPYPEYNRGDRRGEEDTGGISKSIDNRNADIRENQYGNRKGGVFFCVDQR